MYDSNDENIVTKLTPSQNKRIVLTFDDGPSKLLPAILDVLADKEVPAVFFWETRLLYASRPWKRVLQEGHLIGTHSSKHVNMAKLPYEEQHAALKNSMRKIHAITGNEVIYFRPPFGQYNQMTIEAANQLGLTPVLWRIGSFDWELKNDPGQIIENVSSHLEDGAIVLLHETRQTLTALPALIDEIRKQGYTFSLLD